MLSFKLQVYSVFAMLSPAIPPIFTTLPLATARARGRVEGRKSVLTSKKAKTAVFRLNTLVGATLRARSEAVQEMETMLRLNALNQKTTLALTLRMPDAFFL